jgi:hypothetical protein
MILIIILLYIIATVTIRYLSLRSH